MIWMKKARLLLLVFLIYHVHGISVSHKSRWLQGDDELSATSLPSMARLMRNVDKTVQTQFDRDTGDHDVRIPGGLSAPLSMVTDPEALFKTTTPQDTMFLSSVTDVHSKSPHPDYSQQSQDTQGPRSELNEDQSPSQSSLSDKMNEGQDRYANADRFSSVLTGSHYRNAASESTEVEQGVQQTLKTYLDETKEMAATSKNLWSLCDQQLRNVMKKSTEEKRESLTWVGAQKAKALHTLGTQGAKIKEMSKQIEEVQRVFDDAMEKRNAYRLEEQKLTSSNPQTHEASVKRQHSLVLLDFYLKAANNMITESANSVNDRKAELEQTRQWYSKGRDGLAEWLKKQELLVNMRVTKRKEASEKFRNQCRRLDQVFQQSKARVSQYSIALLKERYNSELRAVKEDLFAKRQKIQAAKAEISKMATEERSLQSNMQKLGHKVKQFKVDESQMSAPPRVWKNTISISTVKEGSPVDPSLPPLDTAADGHSLTLKHFEFSGPPPDASANKKARNQDPEPILL